MASTGAPLTAPYFLLDIEFPEKAAGALGEIMTSAGETPFGGMFNRRLGVSTVRLYGPCRLLADGDDDFLTRILDDVVGCISCTGSPLTPERVFLGLQALDEEGVA